MKLKRTDTFTRGDVQMFKDVENGVVSPSDYMVYNLVVFLNGMGKWGALSVGSLFPKAHMSHVTVRKSLRRLVSVGWLESRGIEGTAVREYKALPVRGMNDRIMSVD